MGLVDQQKVERRERVVAAARQVIALEGVDGLTMARVAKAAQVTAPTVYNLVGNREAVISAVLDGATRTVLAGLDAANDSDSPCARVLSIADAFVSQFVEQADVSAPLVRFLFTTSLPIDTDRVQTALRTRLLPPVTSLREQGELLEWADVEFTAYRLGGRALGSARPWAAGELDDASFRACALYDVATGLAGVSIGACREEAEAFAREHQAAALEVMHLQPIAGSANVESDGQRRSS